MRRPRQVRPALEPLESKTLLSSVPVGPAGWAMVSTTKAGHWLRPIGRVRGLFTAPVGNPDAGHAYDLAGSGTVRSVGRATVEGVVHTVGSLQRGNAGGTVALTNPNGSVSLTLKGPQQPDFSKLPYQFRYQITGGSGDFAGARGTGTALLGLGSIGVRHPPNMAPHGSYDLTILGDLPR